MGSPVAPGGAGHGADAWSTVPESRPGVGLGSLDFPGRSCTSPLFPCPSTWHSPWPWWGPLSAWRWLRGVKGMVRPTVLRTLYVWLSLCAPPAHLLQVSALGPHLGRCALCKHPVCMPEPCYSSVVQASQNSCEIHAVSSSVQMGKLRLWEVQLRSVAWTPAWTEREVVSRGKKGTRPLQRAVPGAVWGSPEPCGHLTLSPQGLRAAHRAEESSVLVRAASRSRSTGSLSPPAMLLGAGLRCSPTGQAPVCTYPSGGLCCLELSVGLGCPAQPAEVFPGWEAAQGGSRQLGLRTGDLRALQPGLAAEQGPWLLFCNVPSRWRRGSQ